MLFRIEIATYRNERIRLAIKETLDEQSSFEGLPLPPLGREELTLAQVRLEAQPTLLLRSEIGTARGARR